MSKTQLLDHVVSLNNSPREAVRLAWHSLSDERLTRRRAKVRSSSLMRRRIGVGLAEALVTPATGTHREIAATSLATGGPLTQRWRDLALQERSQLYVFDVKILEALARAEHEEASPHPSHRSIN